MADSEHHTEPTHEFTETIQVPAPHGSGEHAEVDPMAISGQMVVWTWVVFALTLAVLYKVAWKPILAVLDRREKDIQDSIDHAETLREEMARLETVRAEKIAAADEKAQQIIETARKGARDQANLIEERARDEAAILTENAHRDIDISRALAEDSLRVKSAAWARALAGKLIDENLDDEKNRALTDQLIKEL